MRRAKLRLVARCCFDDTGATLRIVCPSRFHDRHGVDPDNAKGGTLLAPVRSAEVRRLSIRQPRLELVGVEDIENPLARDLGAHSDGRGVSIELEVGHGMRVRGEDQLASLFNGKAGEICVEVLAARKAVDLDRHAGIGAGRKNSFPPCLEPRTMMEVTSSRVSKDVHLGCVDGAQEAFGLIAVRVEMRVDGGDHAVDLEAFAFGHIESAVDQDLDLEPLEETVVLAVLIIPALDSLALETDSFSVQSRRDLEAAGMVGDHRPGVAAPTTGPGHRFECGLAVGMTGVPVTGATQPPRMEIVGSGAKSLGHLDAAEIALSGGPATSILTTLKALDCGLQCVFTSAGHELRYQRSEPVRGLSQQFSTRFSRGVEGGVTSTQHGQASVAGRLRVGEAEQRLGQCSVGDSLAAHSRPYKSRSGWFLPGRGQFFESERISVCIFVRYRSTAFGSFMIMSSCRVCIRR